MKIKPVRFLLVVWSLLSVNLFASELPEHLKPLFQEYDGKYRSIMNDFRVSSQPLPAKLRGFESSLNQMKSQVRNKMIKWYTDGHLFSSEETPCGLNCNNFPRAIVLDKADRDVEALFSYIVANS